MKRKSTIKKIIALFLLGVFTLGITPKKELHDLFANHTDNTSKPGDGKTQQLTVAGFNCKCDDLVAESHFIAGAVITLVNPLLVHPCFISFYPSFVSLPQLLFNLRGPPVNV